MIKVNLTCDPPGTRVGTRADPCVSGTFQLRIAPEGDGGPIKSSYERHWISGGIPTNPEMVESWYGKEGYSPKFTCTPQAATSHLRLTATCWHTNDEPSRVEQSLDFWVMAFADEPTPTWRIQCYYGRYAVNKEELDWLKANNHITAGVPYWTYNGTKDELESLLAGSNVEIPIEPPNPHPDGRQSLQICYAPIYGFDYDIHGMRRDPTADIDHMKSMGCKVINLWLYTQHIFYGTNSFSVFNDCYRWYKQFIQYCHEHEMLVCLKLPFWGLPGWFDQPGVPDRGTQKYMEHLKAKANMMSVVNPLEPDFVMLGNEPQLLCSQYPYPPVADGPPAPRWSPEEILAITGDMLKWTAPKVDAKIALVGPALSSVVWSERLPAGCVFNAHLQQLRQILRRTGLNLPVMAV
jgi:hypothetical protein